MNQGQQSINIRPLLPLIAVILFVSVGVVGYTTCQRMNEYLHKALESHARMETQMLAAILGDPFSMGEYDHMQQIIDATKKVDPDVRYVAVLSTDGRVVAATQTDWLNAQLTRNEFEKSALQAVDFTRRDIPNDPSSFEMVMPIKTASGAAGVIRLGFSTKSVSDAAASALVSVMVTAIAAALLGIWAIDMAAKRSPGRGTQAQA